MEVWTRVATRGPVVPVELPALPQMEYRIRLRDAHINQQDHLTLCYLAALPHWRGGARYGATFGEIQDTAPSRHLSQMQRGGYVQWVVKNGQRRYWITWEGIALLALLES